MYLDEEGDAGPFTVVDGGGTQSQRGSRGGQMTLTSLLMTPAQRAFSVAHSIYRRAVNVSALHQEYKAFNFLPDLNSFLIQHLPGSRSAHAFDSFDVHSNIRVLYPPSSQFASSKRLCRLRASPAKPPKPGTRAKPKPAQFDTALFLEDVNGSVPTEGFEGEVTIFC
jgi:hypothetical protein